MPELFKTPVSSLFSRQDNRLPGLDLGRVEFLPFVADGAPLHTLALDALRVAAAYRAVTLARSAEITQEYDKAEAKAAAIWDDAQQISPGVFKLGLQPVREQDPIVQHCLRLQYSSDPSARYVLEQRYEAHYHAITLGEANRFSARLEGGAEPDAVLCEIATLLRERGEHSLLAWISRAEMRGQQPSETVWTILKMFLRATDPDGTLWVVKSPQDVKIKELLERNGIPVCSTRSAWTVNLESGNSQPPGVSFQAAHLLNVLRLLP